MTGVAAEPVVAPAAVPPVAPDAPAVPPVAVVPPTTPPVVVPPVEPPKPVDYSTVVLPQGSTIDPAVLERTVAIARERGLSTEQAQAALDLVTKEVSTTRDAVKAETLAAYQPGGAEWTKQLDAWKAETLADPSLGKTPEERKAAIDRGGLVIKKFAEANPEMGKAMQTFLDTSGLGERRELAHFFAWLGKAAGERQMALPGESGVKTPEQRTKDLYPSMTT